MINRSSTWFLLSFPIGLMGAVQAVFAGLSFAVFGDHEAADFLISSLSLLAIAALIYFTGRRFEIARVGFKDALVFAVLTWVIMGVTGAIPIAKITGVTYTDALFESVSALTTTGATILTGLDAMPKSFLLYRQFLQWLGGLGVVIFVVAVLPMLNIGGMRLMKAETPGPIKDEKLTPRIANTAHYLWLIYFAITVLCALSYRVAGMSSYDAIAHSLTTVSTGGFSTHDASLGYFNSAAILFTANLFMLAGAINFAMHFRVWDTKRPWVYLADEETRTFLIIVVVLALLVSLILWHNQAYQGAAVAFNLGLFQVISFITSTGYGATGFVGWPSSVLFILAITGYLGGCAGSAAGGNKIIRNIITFKLILREMQRLIHPRGVFAVQYQGKTVEPSVLAATMAFMTLSALSSVVITLILVATGLDFWTAFTATAACLNVLGLGVGELGNNFQPVSDLGTWVLSGAMILGRLEYFTVLALFSTYFWRR